MLKQLKTALIMLGLFTLITGIIYPLFVTGVGQALFHHQANGSLITENGTIIGSELIGQPFSAPDYFWGRLSATLPYPYNAAASSGSNYGPSDPALVEAVENRIAALKAADPDNNAPIPVDLVTASASGLDPDISIAAAEYQAARVARYRGLTEIQIKDLIKKHTEGRQLGLLGEPRVNVLKLNLALDNLD
jgi:potassium-transporting ATPase KdpC subunit